MLKKYPDSPWDWGMVSRHRKITWNDIEKNPNLKWDKNYIAMNPNITWDIIIDNNISVYNFPYNRNFEIDLFWKNPNLEWNFSALIVKHNILEKMESSGFDLFNEWVHRSIGINFKPVDLTVRNFFIENIPIRLIGGFYEYWLKKVKEENRYIYNFDFSDRKDLTLDIIQKCPKFNWNWDVIFKRFEKELKLKSE
jgi:hypothetical protein